MSFAVQEAAGWLCRLSARPQLLPVGGRHNGTGSQGVLTVHQFDNCSRVVQEAAG